jgi:hypothetical protein
VRRTRLRWHLAWIGAVPLWLGEALGLVPVGARSLALWRIDPLGAGPLQAPLAAALAAGAPLAVGIALATAERWLARAQPRRSMRVLALVGLWVVLVAAGQSAAGVVTLAMLALLVAAVAETTAFVVDEVVSAGVGAGLSLAVLSLLDWPLAVAAITIGVVALVGLGTRRSGRAGVAFVLVLSYPTAALATGVAFVDWRLTGTLSSLGEYLALQGISHPLVVLVTGAIGILVVAVPPRVPGRDPCFTAGIAAAAAAAAVAGGLGARSQAALVLVAAVLVASGARAPRSHALPGQAPSSPSGPGAAWVPPPPAPVA